MYYNKPDEKELKKKWVKKRKVEKKNENDHKPSIYSHIKAHKEILCDTQL